jgi:CBS domain-containing protein
MTVSDLMVTNVQSAHTRTKADVIASLMIEGFGSVPVVDDRQRLIGIVTEHDLLGSLERGQQWGAVSAETVMSPNPYSVRPETDVATLIHVMRAGDLIRVPVVDGDGRLIGIVARRDILKAYLSASNERPRKYPGGCR